MITVLKIAGIPSDYSKMSFGHQLDYRSHIEKFKSTAKSAHISQKRQSYKKAIKEFIRLNNVSEYYCRFNCEKWYKDDCFEIFYK